MLWWGSAGMHTWWGITMLGGCWASRWRENAGHHYAGKMLQKAALVQRIVGFLQCSDAQHPPNIVMLSIILMLQLRHLLPACIVLLGLMSAMQLTFAVCTKVAIVPLYVSDGMGEGMGVGGVWVWGVVWVWGCGGG